LAVKTVEKMVFPIGEINLPTVLKTKPIGKMAKSAGLAAQPVVKMEATTGWMRQRFYPLCVQGGVFAKTSRAKRFFY